MENKNSNIVDINNLKNNKGVSIELEESIIKSLKEYIEKKLSKVDAINLTLNKLNLNKEKIDVVEAIYKKLYNDFTNKKKHLEKYEKPWYSINEKGKVTLIVNPLAEHIVKKYKIIMITPVLHFYANGVYKPLTDSEIKTFIKLELYEEYKTPHNINQVFLLITEMSSNIIKKIEDFDSDANIINFKNGLYNIKTNELMSHDENYLSLFQLNCQYNPFAVCPVWDAFIEDALYSDKQTINALEEALGYMCIKDIKAQKMFVLHGKSNTGKSVVLSLYKKIIGDAMFTSATLQELAKSDSKVVHQLRGKLANVCGDLPQKPIEDTGLLKQLTGEDDITADIKFKEAITFKNYARLLFSCNQMPTSYTDKSEAFYNRLLIIPFNNVKKESEMDRELKDKLFNEIEGIMLRLIDGIKRLRENKYVFTTSDVIKTELQDYKIKNDTVLGFIYDVYKIIPIGKFESNPNVKPRKYTELYLEYTRYCHHMNYKYCNKKIFKESLLRNQDIYYKAKHQGTRDVIMNLALNIDELDYDLFSEVFEWGHQTSEKSPFDTQTKRA